MATNKQQPLIADFGVQTVGNITGNYFIGNGSQLTGITSTASNLVAGPGITITEGGGNTGGSYIKAAYMDVTATGSVATITPQGYKNCNLIIFGFANIATPNIDTAWLAAMQKATSNSTPGTTFAWSVGGAYYDGSTINTTTAASIIANVHSQIQTYNASLTGGQITEVDLDLENGITTETITQMVNGFKALGYTICIAPQLIATAGVDISPLNPNNLGMSSGGATNQYGPAIASGNVDAIFVQAYNSGGFTVGNNAPTTTEFFLSAAQALSNCVESGLQVNIPANTKIIIGEPSNSGAAFNINNIFGVAPGTPYTQSTTLNTINSMITTMIADPTTYGNIAGVGQWSLNNDFFPSAYGDNYAVSGAFTTTIFGPTAPLSTGSTPIPGNSTVITSVANLQLVTTNGATTTANITAPYFIGNGALLTGIASSGGNSITNGNSNVSIATSNGNIRFVVNAVNAGNITASQVSIGAGAGRTNQGTNAVAIGFQAGFVNQGANAIAIGANAGISGQIANSIILNASGNILNSVNAGTYINPIRLQTDLSNVTGGQLYYNSTTKEVIYTTSLPTNWINAGNIQTVGITATTTAPTLQPTANVNRVYYKQISSKTWQVQGMYTATGGTGAAPGSGDYLFTLPAGLQFDTTLPFQTTYTGNVNTSADFNQIACILESSSSGYELGGTPGQTTSGYVGGVAPYSATQYRVCLASSFGVRFIGSGWVQAASPVSIQWEWQFTFQST